METTANKRRAEVDEVTGQEATAWISVADTLKKEEDTDSIQNYRIKITDPTEKRQSRADTASYQTQVTTGARHSKDDNKLDVTCKAQNTIKIDTNFVERARSRRRQESTRPTGRGDRKEAGRGPKSRDKGKKGKKEEEEKDNGIASNEISLEHKEWEVKQTVGKRVASSSENELLRIPNRLAGLCRIAQLGNQPPTAIATSKSVNLR